MQIPVTGVDWRYMQSLGKQILKLFTHCVYVSFYFLMRNSRHIFCKMSLDLKSALCQKYHTWFLHCFTILIYIVHNSSKAVFLYDRVNKKSRNILMLALPPGDTYRKTLSPIAPVSQVSSCCQRLATSLRRYSTWTQWFRQSCEVCGASSIFCC